MKRRALWFISMAMLLLLLPLPPTVEAGGFDFVYVTDSHLGSGPGNNYTPKAYEVIAGLKGIGFLIHGGDVVETGSEAEYRSYRQLLDTLNLPAYHVPGNHESRWLDAGGARFRRQLGPPFFSFEYGGWLFIGLDTTVPGETHGHLNPQMLAWLARELEAAGDKPVVIVSHHPLAYDRSRFLDNDDDFLEVISGHNVRAVLSGHGHIYLRWNRNGVPFIMGPGIMENGSFLRFKVLGNRLEVYQVGLDGQERLLEVLEPSGEDAGVEIRRLGAEGNRLALSARVSVPETGGARVEYRIGLGTYQPMTPGADGLYSATADLSAYDPGTYNVRVRVSFGDQVFSDRGTLKIAGDGSPREAWTFRADGAIQGEPAIEDGILYFGTSAGTLYALDADSGLKLWETGLEGAVTGSPAVYGRNLYVGTAEGYLYALDRNTGREIWRYAAGGPVLDGPVIGKGHVFFGNLGGGVTSLDPATGGVIWDNNEVGPVRSPVAVGGGRVYAGSWDGKLWALDFLTGEVLWSNPLGRNVYYAPATAGPLYAYGKVFAVTSNDSQKESTGLWVLDAARGELLWRSSSVSGYAAPYLSGRTVVASDLSGKVQAYDAFDGSGLFSVSSGYSSYDSGPVMTAAGWGVTGSLAGKVTGFTPDGVLWRYTHGDGFIFATVKVSGNRVFAANLSGELVAIDVPVPEGPPADRTEGFSDTSGHWAEGEILFLSELGLSRGYEDGSFRPGADISRAEAAVMLARVLGGKAGETGAFADTRGHWAEAEIDYLAEKGIVRGFETGPGEFSFLPGKAITRAEAAAMLQRTFGIERPATGTSFRDMADHWARGPVAALESAGLVGGYRKPDGSYFLPQQKISRAEFAALLSRVLRY